MEQCPDCDTDVFDLNNTGQHKPERPRLPLTAPVLQSQLDHHNQSTTSKASSSAINTSDFVPPPPTSHRCPTPPQPQKLSGSACFPNDFHHSHQILLALHFPDDHRFHQYHLFHHYHRRTLLTNTHHATILRFNTFLTVCTMTNRQTTKHNIQACFKIKQ